VAELEDTTLTWSCSLTTKELADAFRSAATNVSQMSRLQRFSAAMAGRQRERASQRALGNLQPKKFADMDDELAFFTPQSGDSPFAQFDEMPAFAAGASIPQRDGNPLAAHFFVQDRGEHAR